MASNPDLQFPGRRRGAALLRAVGLRVVVWGGLILGAVIWAGGFHWLSRTAAPPRTADEQYESSEPQEIGWPNYRGPTHDGVSTETGLADSWPAGGPPVLWRREIGRGYSGLIAVGKCLYTQGQNAVEQSVVCLDADSGELVWEHRYGWAFERGGMYPGPRATPSWHAGRIYFASPDGLVGCLRGHDGSEIWSLNVNQKFSGRGTDFGYSCSPLVEAGKVILPVGGPGASVVALNESDGSTVWASGDEPASYCSPLPITLAGRRLVVAFLQNALAALDLESGRILWQRPYSRGYDEHSAQPVYQEPYLMVMLPFQAGADLYRFESEHASANGGATSGLTARLVRHSAEMSNDTASSVLVDGCVYGFDLREAQANGRRSSRGAFRCMELQSGKVRWSTDRVGHATVLGADKKLFLFNDKGELILARASPERYEELGRTKVFGGETCWTAPTLDRGRIYLRSPTKAACLLVNSAAMSALDRSPRVSPPPETTGGEPADMVWLLGKEREYPFDPPDRAEWTAWYVWSLLGSLGGAAVAAMMFRLVTGRSPDRRRRSSIVFWSAAFLLGLAMTPLANRCTDRFVLTWPVSVFVVHQFVLVAIFRSQRQPITTFARWAAPCAAILFVLFCFGYYELCRRLNVAPAWLFLLGFLPSWPFAIPVANRLLRGGKVGPTAVWIVLAFSVFFWSSAAAGWVKTLLVR